jgi:hypothetical protein
MCVSPDNIALVAGAVKPAFAFCNITASKRPDHAGQIAEPTTIPPLAPRKAL